tara:strand:+ start:292 stop:597 length:306 start_codon:yes stop_codon:yes gene_type:complete
MSRWLVGMSGDKDAMIRHLEKCEKRMLEQFASIKEIATKHKTDQELGIGDKFQVMSKYRSLMDEIIALCDVYVDRRSDKQKMQDEIDELKEQVRKLTEGDE